MTTRGLDIKDLQLRVNWMNNPKVYSSMHFDVPILIENTIKWFENNIGNKSRADLTFEDNGEIVAFGGFIRINTEIKTAELYIFVNPEAQKNGIGTKVTKDLCKYGFEVLSLNKIYLETNEDNKVAQRLYEKCGFKLEGIHREEYKTKDGQLLSRMYYGILKGELND